MKRASPASITVLLCNLAAATSAFSLLPSTSLQSNIRIHLQGCAVPCGRLWSATDSSDHADNESESGATATVTATATAKNDSGRDSTNGGQRKPCYFQRVPGSRQWSERIHLSDLKVGQELHGTLSQEYLSGKTGPKLYFECGVGTTNESGDWSMVSGMLRLGRSKKSVAKKRTARIRKRGFIDLYVSRIFEESGRLEVCQTPEAVEGVVSKLRPMVSASSLRPSQVVEGTVTRLVPYGAFVDVGANRNGLLHITKVAELYSQYIDKEAGLKKAGLEKGAKVRLQILSNEKKKVELDFTDDVKQAARDELARDQARLGTKSELQPSSSPSSDSGTAGAVSSAAPATAAVAATTAFGVAASTATTMPTPVPAQQEAVVQGDDASGDVDDNDNDGDDPHSIYAEYADDYAADYADYTKEDVEDVGKDSASSTDKDTDSDSDRSYDDGDDGDYSEYDDYDDEDYDDYDEERDIEDSLGLGTY